MAQPLSKYLTISGRLFLSLFFLSLSACTQPAEDYDLYGNMKSYAQEKFLASGATLRQDMPEAFTQDYIANLSGLIRLVFGASQLQVHLTSYESSAMAVASISQFEVPPASGNFTDCAFVVRPAANMRAPFLHGDALKGMAGMSTSFSMDFYNVDNASIDVDTFFGDQIAKLQEGLALVEQYQRTGEDRGKYTKHLVPYKSKYRIEIEQPDTKDETELKAYADSALAAYKIFMDAYFTSLERLQPENNATLIQGVKDGTATFITILYENDTAVKLGKMLLDDDFDDYFLKGFWREGYYGSGL